jgi:hypothetical protein
MKQFLFMICLLATVTPVVSQTQKGGWLVGSNVGSSGWQSGKDKWNAGGVVTTRSFNISAGPTALFFVQDNLAIGASMNVAYTAGKSKSTTVGYYGTVEVKSRDFNISFDPEIRKYFGKPGSKGQPWVNVFGGINTNPTRIEWSDLYGSGKGTNKHTGWNLGAGVGYSHFINDRVALQYYLNYRHVYLKTKEDVGVQVANEASGKDHNHTINFGIGLQIHLKSKLK